MKPVAQTPTTPAHYAALSAVYASMLGGVVLSSRGREPIPRGELVPLAAASFALSKLVVREKVESWVREPFVEERPDGERHPRGEGLRYAMGELLSCTRCVGAWSSLALVGLRLRHPTAGKAVTAVLASSAGSDFLQGSFSWLCAHSTRAESIAADRIPSPTAEPNHARL